jgi:Glycosyl transferase family, helical bundle domain
LKRKIPVKTKVFLTMDRKNENITTNNNANSSSENRNTIRMTSPPPIWFNPVVMIARRRANEREDTDEELQVWIQQYVLGTVPDYQMAAWLMAVCFHPLSARETATLTQWTHGVPKIRGRMSIRVTGYDFAAGGASRNGVTFVSPSPISFS